MKNSTKIRIAFAVAIMSILTIGVMFSPTIGLEGKIVSAYGLIGGWFLVFISVLIWIDESVNA